MFNDLVKKFNRVIDISYFFDIYLCLLSGITILGYILNTYVGILLLLIIAIPILIIKNDAKYLYWLLCNE